MIRKNVVIWLAGFLILFFIEACLRITINVPYFMTMQAVTFLLYAAVGCVAGLLVGLVLLALRRIFPATNISYNCVSMAACIASVLSISLFFYLFKGAEVFVYTGYIVKSVLILSFSAGVFLTLYFLLRRNERKGRLFICYISLLPPLWVIAILVFRPNANKFSLPSILRITDLTHLIPLIVVCLICFCLLYLLLPLCSRFIAQSLRSPLLRACLIGLSLILVLFVFAYPMLKQKQHSRSDGTKLAPGSVPNIVLITMDTVRADHLACYGYDRLTTPNVDQLAREGVLYKNAYSTTSWTLPSHASLFTGMYPSKHGAHFNSDFLNAVERSIQDPTDQPLTWSEQIIKTICKLSDKNTTLAEVLSQQGYRTAGIIGGPFCSSSYGIAQGFEYYNENFFNYNKDIDFYFLYQVIELFYPLKDPMAQYGYSTFKRLASQLNEFAFQWLEKNSSKPFFLFINYFDAHRPYLPPHPYDEYFNKISPNVILKYASGLDKSYFTTENKFVNNIINNIQTLTPEEREFLVSRYDGGIRYLDHHLGLLFERLKALKVYDNTLIIVISDHGEAFGEHNLVDHNRTLYDELLRVPLIIKYPSAYKRSGVIEKQVSLVDIFPTILKTLNVPIPADIDGQPLPESNHYIIAEWHMRWFDGERYRRDLKAIYQGKEKLIWASNSLHELYDLEHDPGETINLIKTSPQRALSMEKTLKQWLGSFKPPAASDSKTNLNESDVEKLRSLGYVN